MTYFLATQNVKINLKAITNIMAVRAAEVRTIITI